MFHDFCNSCIERYGLDKEHTITQEAVRDIDYGSLEDGIGPTAQNTFTIRTDDSVYHAKVVVLAIGAGTPIIPRPFSPAIQEGACHAMNIQRHKGMLLDPSVTAKASSGKATNVLVIGGGLTSAQICDGIIKTGVVAKVWLFMRGPWKIKPFDVDLSWIAKFKNHQQASFWSADTDEERVNYVKEARNGGSMTPRYAKILRRHLQANKLRVETNARVRSAEYCTESKTWDIQTEEPIEGLPRFDYIYFATGAHTDLGSLGCLQTIQQRFPIKTCGGLPVLTDELKWSNELPLFMTGKLATLRLGPGAGNLEGARAGAERVAWAVQDLLHGEMSDQESSGDEQDAADKKLRDRYVAGVGSMYASLRDEDVE